MWNPAFGAVCAADGVHFTVWAPDASEIKVVVEGAEESAAGEHRLAKGDDGLFFGILRSVLAGDLYRYRVDGRLLYPDPASRFQPHGVHGPSEIVDPAIYEWQDSGWTGLPIEKTVFYELHLGTFTPEGTLQGARCRLPYLKDLGITAIELMPIADFPGAWNWGYDGAALFAPSRCYGRPDDLRQFVDEAHRLGLAVYLDVIYNHFGPDGSYAVALSSRFFSPRHRSPWGDGINLDDVGAEQVRRFFIENALHWIHEYHIDGLRLDATHVLVDESPQHFLAELSSTVRTSLADSCRKAMLIAEDTRNSSTMLLPAGQAGWQIDAVWADDFHHQMRRHLTGDSEGYYMDFAGTIEDIAATARQGWFYTGQYAEHFGHHRGTDPADIPLSRFVFFIQNHDQIGNRAFGDRLHHSIDDAVYRAASVLLLLLPETPLLFMGQEWAATTPFQFFTDHSQELGKLVTAGRRQEFAKFRAFMGPETPDPQSPNTFHVSKLDWSEKERAPHLPVLRLYRRLLELRRAEPALASRCREDFTVSALDSETLALIRYGNNSACVVLVRIQGSGVVHLDKLSPETAERLRTCAPVLTTEDADYVVDPSPIQICSTPPAVAFSRPGAVVFRTGEYPRFKNVSP